jgi:hypothetical protein
VSFVYEDGSVEFVVLEGDDERMLLSSSGNYLVVSVECALRQSLSL